MARPSNHQRVVTPKGVVLADDTKPLVERVRVWCRWQRSQGVNFVALHDVVCETGAAPEAVMQVFKRLERDCEGLVVGGPNRGWSFDIRCHLRR